jgi:hypothetical protein
MSPRVLRMLAIVGAAALTARADLYLLAASPNLKGLGSPYGASLIYVDSQGAVSEAREVASATPGVYWIGVSYEERKAVVVTDSLTPPLHLPKMIVVDFDKGDVVKTCEFNAWAESRLDTWLAVQPGMGLSLEWGTGSYDSGNNMNVTLGGALVDPSVSCEKSMWTAQAEDARYLVASGWAGAAPGKIILVGYSMGRLMSRDVIANNYGSLVSSGKIAALITLGTPNLGYPYVALDNLMFCAQLVNDMAGAWNPVIPGLAAPGEYLSSYLSGLTRNWQSTSYAGPWLAGAGQQCGNGIRNFNFVYPTQPIGCPTVNGRGDGVVCLASASYPGALAAGPTPLANTWQDTGQIYVHTNSYAG